MLSHTQIAWARFEDCRETQLRVRKSQGVCEVSAMTQDGWNGDPQHAAERPNEGPKKDRAQSVQGFCSCRERSIVGGKS